MSPAIVVGFALALLAFLQPGVCGFLAAHKNRSVPLWVLLGALFGIVPAAFAGLLFMMLSAMSPHDQDDGWLLVFLLIPFLWPSISLLLKPKLEARSLRSYLMKSRRGTGMPQKPLRQRRPQGTES